MNIAIAVLTGLLFSTLSILLIYVVSRRSFFQNAFKILDEYSLPEKPRSKGELRRYKKLRGMISSARRKILLLFIIHLIIFTASYFFMIITLQKILVGTGLVEIPIPIPFLTGKTDNHYYTHILFLSFLAYLTPLYFFIRAVRPVSR